MEMTVAELAERLKARLAGDKSDADRLIEAVRPIEAADENQVTFIKSEKHKASIGKSRAGAVIVADKLDDLDKPQIIVKDVDAALIETLTAFAPQLKPVEPGIDPTAKIAEGAKLADGVSVGAGVVVKDGVRIGRNSILADGCKIGENSTIGKNCRIDGNVVIYHNCRLGDNVIIQANSTIGSTGFGYSFIEGAHELIPHNGGVVIELSAPGRRLTISCKSLTTWSSANAA